MPVILSQLINFLELAEGLLGAAGIGRQFAGEMFRLIREEGLPRKAPD